MFQLDWKSPGPKVVLPLWCCLWSWLRVCVCVCCHLHGYRLNAEQGQRNHTVGRGGWNASEFPTLACKPCHIHVKLRESVESCLSAAVASSLSTDTLVLEWGRSEEDQRENQFRKKPQSHICSRTLISMTAALIPHPMNKKETLRLRLTLTIAEKFPERLKWLWIELKPPCWSTCLSDCLGCASYPAHTDIIYA